MYGRINFTRTWPVKLYQQKKEYIKSTITERHHLIRPSLMLQWGRLCLNLTEVPKRDRRGGPSSFWDWDRVSRSRFVTVMGVSRPKTEDRRPKAEDRRPKAEDRRPKTEDRRPKTEDRRPKAEDRRPKTEDRRFGNQLNEMCWNAFFDAKTMKSIRFRFSFCSFRSSFCSFTRLKLQNEEPRWNVLFEAKILKSMGSSFCTFAHLKLQNEDPL